MVYIWIQINNKLNINTMANLFDIKKAVAKTRIAKRSSQHSCAKYVRTYLEAGGLNTTGRPVSAYQYSDFLPKLGFKKIADVSGQRHQAEWTSDNAQPGDISVMKHGQHGHICMWTGSAWVSDFVQTRMYPYPDNGRCEIFRFA